MIRRALAPLVALALIAAAASGCGSSSTSGGLGNSLSYMPKDSPLVVAISTDINGDQYKQLDKLVGKFPFGGAVKQQIKTRLATSSGTDWEKIKPLLGDDFVVGVTTPSGLTSPGDPPFVVAWHVNGGDVKKKLIPSSSQKVSTVEGTDVYKSTSGSNYGAVKDDTLVVSRDQAGVEQALKRAAGDDHLTEDDFNAALGDLDKDALVRSTGNLQAALSGAPGAAAAKKIPWINALESYGQTVSAEPDGIELRFAVKTKSGLQEKDLPLASGSQSAPVVRRGGEIGFGIRNPAQLFNFGLTATQLTDPAAYAKFKRQEAKVGKQLGVNVERDLIGQLSGNSALSISLTGAVAFRADLRDPAAAEATLKKAAPRLVKVAKSQGKSLGLSTPKNGKGFYGLAQANGKKVVFGVVGKSFVAATDAARAAQFAGQSPSTVPGAKGSFVLASDARALANAVAQRQGQGTAAQIVTGALGDLTGWIETEPSQTSGTFKLFIK